jgi:alkaline phosphatase D
MHDPIGIVTGGPGDYDAYGNNDPRNLGRELEMQDLLGYIRARNIRNVNVITSDVHFAALVNYDPIRATGGFTAFDPFDEFVIGPIHAGSFGPNTLDTSFGPQYQYGTFCVSCCNPLISMLILDFDLIVYA